MKELIKEAARLKSVAMKEPKPKRVYKPREYISRMNLRITKEVITGIESLAEKEGVKGNQLIRFVLAESFAKPLDTSITAEQYPKVIISRQFDMPLEMKAELEKRAAELNLKMSELVREILKQYLRENVTS
jgi:predicted DNA binding CopG/RHH family protein